MQTLGLLHGDLVIDAGGYAMVSGAARIRQDLTLALLEEYGSDRFHPRYGSIVKQYLGSVITPDIEQLVKAEVNRVIQNYVTLQQAEVLRYSQLDVVGRYDTSDVVRNMDSIEVRSVMDAIYITAALTTLARETITLTRQVGN